MIKVVATGFVDASGYCVVVVRSNIVSAFGGGDASGESVADAAFYFFGTGGTYIVVDCIVSVIRNSVVAVGGG